MTHQDVDLHVLKAEKLTAGESSDSLLLQLPDEQLTIVTLMQSSCRIKGRDDHGLRAVTLVPGDVSVIAPGNAVTLARISPHHPTFEVACISLSAAFLSYVGDALDVGTAGDGLETLHTLQTFDPQLASMAQLLLRTLTAGASDPYTFSAAQFLAAYLLHPRHETPSSKGILNPEQLAAVTTYMRDHIAADITLEDLAGQALLSRYHFIRRFSDTTGKTPFRYLTELRVEAARHLLVTTGEPVSQIGRRCGFPTPENFARVFRKHVGCSPSQYRRRGEPAG